MGIKPRDRNQPRDLMTINLTPNQKQPQGCIFSLLLYYEWADWSLLIGEPH